MLDPPGEVHRALAPAAADRYRSARCRSGCPGTQPGNAAHRAGRPRAPALAGDGAGGHQVTAAQRGGQPYQPGPVPAEAGDDQPGRRDLGHHQRPGRDEQVHPFGHDELAHVADDPVPGRVGGQSACAAPGSRPTRAGRPPAVGQRGKPGRRLGHRARMEPADVHPRRQQPGPRGQARHVHHLPQALRGVPGPDERGRAPQAFPGVATEPVGMRATGIPARIHGSPPLRHPAFERRARITGPITT